MKFVQIIYSISKIWQYFFDKIIYKQKPQTTQRASMAL